jgi:hypothetical protein
LNGFIAVSGKPAVIAEKIKRNFVEPGFEHRATKKARSSALQDGRNRSAG